MKVKSIRNALLAGAAILGIISGGFSTMTHAAGPIGSIVFDPSNFAKNSIASLQSIRQTIYQAQMVTQQIRQIQNEINMLANQGKMLTKLPTDLAGDLFSSIQQMENILGAARGLVLDYNTLQSQFDEAFRNEDYTGWSGTDYQASAGRLSQQTIDAVNDALMAQGLVADLSIDRLTLDQLLGASKSSVGQLQALQAANQISGLLVTQMMRMETVMAESAKAQVTYIASQTKGKQDSDAEIKAQVDAIRQPWPTPALVNDDRFLNPVGTRAGEGGPSS